LPSAPCTARQGAWHACPPFRDPRDEKDGFLDQKDDFLDQEEGFREEKDDFLDEKEGFRDQMDDFRDEIEGLPEQMKGFLTFDQQEAPPGE
jgi:hypothetical protein